MKNPLSEERARILREFLQGLGMENVDPVLVNQALTHSTYSYEQGLSENNERLEFLGDAILGFVVGEYLYTRYPGAPEGDLSVKRATMVSRPMLGRLGKSLGLGQILLLGHGQNLTGGRKNSNILGSALEALIGALYLDGGLEAVSELIHREIIIPGESLLEEEAFTDYKSRLQEYVQKKFRKVPDYRVLKSSGPDHKRHFLVEVQIEGKRWGTGSGNRKKLAENEAARKALESLKSGEDEDSP